MAIAVAAAVEVACMVEALRAAAMMDLVAERVELVLVTAATGVEAWAREALARSVEAACHEGYVQHAMLLSAALRDSQRAPRAA